ncbi:SDR family NAD(P)-dependent oxidoreductase, partial [Streptomyces triticirhizae]
MGPDPFELAEAARDAGAEVVHLPDLAALDAALAAGETPPARVVMACAGPADEGAPVAAAHHAALSALAAVREWLAGERFAALRLVFVTRGAVAARPGPEIADLAASPVWGLVRSATSENPGRFGLVDLDGTPASAAPLAGALALDEPQVALRDGGVRVPRMTPVERAAGRLTPPAGAGAWRLDVTSRGTLGNLALLPAPDAEGPLGPEEVRVRVVAGGLNFRDVMVGLGMYPGDDARIGGEAAGVVLEVGSGVTGLAVGDPVMGLFPGGGIGPVAVSDHRWLTRVPEGLTFHQAAVLPVVFLTAYYGLVDLAGVGEGESLLIHAAAGGVGMAAAQLGRHWGLELYGTASPGKWDTLRAMGFADDHIASSRDLDFEERFREASGGRGVDVVLNSLANEFVDASARLLPPGGRLLEMGKTDIRDEAEMAARYPGTRYWAYDLMRVSRERVQEMLTELGGLFASGALKPLPVTAWPAPRSADALRFLSQARHIGKMAISLPTPLDPDGTVLITGGTGVLGGLTARHLVTAHGARRLLLTSRAGAAAPGVEELAAELRALGAEVTVAACDTTDRAALAALLADVPNDHPLTAVFHAAGAVDDGLVSELTDEGLTAVLRPKVDAAWHLHELTRDLDLAAFVLYSSLAGTLGTPGQANYAAANAFLDALAHHRQTLGLPGASVAWGLWETTSALTAHVGDADRARMARLGVLPLDSEVGLALLDSALAAREPHTAAFALDRAALRSATDAGLPLPAPLSGLVRARPAV